MAEFGITAPGPILIDSTASDQNSTWTKWITHMECFFTASGIEDTKRKKALVLYCGGEDLRKIHDTLNDEKETYKDTKDLLDKYFETKSNITLERHVFRNVSQLAEENIRTFITRLREQSSKCKFDEYSEDQALVDQIIEKCNSNKLRRKLLQEQNLTVEKVIKIATAQELTTQCASVIENSNTSEELKAIKFKPKNSNYPPSVNPRNSSYNRRETSNSNFNFNKTNLRCYNCDKEGHFANSPQCPARGHQCRYCKKYNHYPEVCRSRRRDMEERKFPRNESNKHSESNKQVHSLAAEDSDEEGYIFKLGKGNNTDIILNVEGHNMEFLVDSGSCVDVIDRGTFDQLQSKVKVNLHPSKVKIYAYASETPLKIDGMFYGNISFKGSKHICRFHVISDHKSGCVIGRNTAIELGILKLSQNIHALTSDSIYSAELKKKYPAVFQGLGKLKGFQLKLNIDSSVPPVSQHLRRIPFHVRKKIEIKIKELEDLDIIEKVPDSEPTSWVSPIIAIPKGNDVRMVVDMRRANEAIKRTHYPVPTLEELLESFRGCTLFSKVDLVKGYHQIELCPESRKITTFITHTGIYRYRRLVQGANSALEEYQHVIGDLFKSQDRISNIVDDILIGGVNEEDHDKNLNNCMQILQDNHLTVNESKCEWKRKEVSFFGHTLSAEGIKPLESKVEAVKSFPPPKSRKQLSSFLGLINFLAKFIPNLAKETATLRTLLRRDSEWIWGENEQNAFESLKLLATSDTVLAHFNTELETFLITDAGAVGLGAILAQKQHDSSLRPVQYASRALTQQEKKYSQTEKEALAVVWGCERFHIFLYGKSFNILTDHQPLKVLYSNNGKPSPRILRWSLRMQSYEYKVQHIPGSTNPADILSNSPLKKTSNNESSEETEKYINHIIAYHTPKGITLNEIMEESSKDSTLSKVSDCIQRNEWSQEVELKPYKQVKYELCSKGGIILKDGKIVIPTKLRKRVLAISHETHMGITKTKELLKQKVWWPGWEKEVDLMIKSCVPCLSMSIPSKEPLKHLNIENAKPFEKLFLDIQGPYPSGDYVVGIIDGFSKWPDAYVIRSTSSENIVKCLLNTCCTHGFPLQITSDNGANVASVEIDNFCSEYGITHRKSLPYWPRGNSEIERLFRTLGKFIKICETEGRRWQNEIPKFLLTYRNTPHCSTEFSPAQLLMNRQLRCKLPQIIEHSPYHEMVEENNRKVKERNESDFNSKRNVKISNIKEGDWVLVKQKRKNKLSTNFDPNPWKVENRSGSKLQLSRENARIVRNVNDTVFVPPTNHEEFSDVSDGDIESESTHEDSESEEQIENRDLNVGRPRRQRRLPSRFGDYVVENI